MKQITMEVKRWYGVKGWKTAGKQDFNRVSGWIRIKTNYNPTERNSLWYYVQDENGCNPNQYAFNPENGLFLDYFTFRGKNYALDQFMALNNTFWNPVGYTYINEGGKTVSLAGVDSENYFNPIYIEIDPCGERVRVYEEV